jgi:hypothetical protein
MRTIAISVVLAAASVAAPAHASCAAPKTMSGTWKSNDGGTYYVRETGQTIWWMGESKKGGFTNVFRGTRNGNVVTGSWADIKGGTGNGLLTLTIVGAKSVLGFKQKSSTGGFGGTNWFQPCDDTVQNPVD